MQMSEYSLTLITNQGWMSGQECWRNGTAKTVMLKGSGVTSFRCEQGSLGGTKKLCHPNV